MLETPMQAIMPWDLLYPKQIQLFNTGIETDAKIEHPDCPTILLVDGGRKMSKSHGVIHRNIRHLYETPGARTALVVKITRSATDGGIWNDVVGSDILPGGEMQKWIDAGLTEYTTENKFGGPAVTDSKTRSIYFRIRNMHGGQSELRLFNLEHDHDVGPVMKSTKFSAIWFSELTNFQDPDVLRYSWEQLRMAHLEPWQHLWIGDTNPSPEGEDHWIYKFFYKREIISDGATRTAGMEQYLRSIKRITFFPQDHLGMSPTQWEIQRANYSHDPGEEARMVDGQWTKGHGNKGKHFADLFSRSIHVIGGGPGETDRIAVSSNTTTLRSGWDLGDGTNHGCGLLEKRMVTIQEKTETGEVVTREVSSWNVLASILHIGEHISIGDIGIEMVKEMREIEEQCGRKFEYLHYSDDTALNRWRPTSSSFDYMEIRSATNDEIELLGVSKPSGSVRKRVQLVRKLLRQQRLFVAARCTDVIGMLENLAEGDKASDYVVWNKWKHVFDWMTYPMIAELAEELEERKRPAAIQEYSDSGLVTVPL